MDGYAINQYGMTVPEKPGLWDRVTGFFGGGDKAPTDNFAQYTNIMNQGLYGPTDPNLYTNSYNFQMPWMQTTDPQDMNSNWLAAMQNQTIASMANSPLEAQSLISPQFGSNTNMANPLMQQNQSQAEGEDGTIVGKLVWGSIGVAGTIGFYEMAIRGLGIDPMKGTENHKWGTAENNKFGKIGPQADAKNYEWVESKKEPGVKKVKVRFDKATKKLEPVKVSKFEQATNWIHRQFYKLGNIGVQEGASPEIAAKGNKLRQAATWLHNKIEAIGSKIYNLFVHGGGAKAAEAKEASWIVSLLRGCKGWLKNAPVIGPLLRMNIGGLWGKTLHLGSGLRKIGSFIFNMMTGAATKHSTAAFLAVGALWTAGTMLFKGDDHNNSALMAQNQMMMNSMNPTGFNPAFSGTPSLMSQPMTAMG